MDRYCVIALVLEIPVNELSVYVMRMYLAMVFQIVCFFLQRKVVYILTGSQISSLRSHVQPAQQGNITRAKAKPAAVPR